MENASKALIIAGAVLISILLISIGISILNSTRGTTDSAKNAMSDLEIKAFNSKFTPYEGSNKSAKEVIQLLDNVISSNSSHSNQVVVKFYKDWSLMNTKYSDFKDSLPIPYATALVLTNDIYFSEKGHYAAENGHRIVNINTIKDTINILKRGKFDVKLFYCNEEEAKHRYNKHLNLSNSCIFFIWIDLV